MKGNTFEEFMSDILACGGPEKEFTFHGTRYFLEATYHKDKELIELYVFEVNETDTPVYSFWGKDLCECVEQFGKARIFDGKTIYEAEKDITVLFG